MDFPLVSSFLLRNLSVDTGFFSNIFLKSARSSVHVDSHNNLIQRLFQHFAPEELSGKTYTLGAIVLVYFMAIICWTGGFFPPVPFFFMEKLVRGYGHLNPDLIFWNHLTKSSAILTIRWKQSQHPYYLYVKAFSIFYFFIYTRRWKIWYFSVSNDVVKGHKQIYSLRIWKITNIWRWGNSAELWWPTIIV